MNVAIFNGCLVAGLLLVTVGAGQAFGFGIGLLVGGGALLALTLLVARLFGVFEAEPNTKDSA